MSARSSWGWSGGRGQEGAGAVGCVLGHPGQVLGAGPGEGRVVEGGGGRDDGVEV
ncbi:hypothetical protein [Streptomyces sp. NPDC051219]|uniref:hypothetical protein n=1 Tax=Streptomyces sp. NPDC051219 TaxID=3155283 RepID=UPI0034237AC5